MVLEKLCNRDVWNSHGFFIWFVKCITKDLKSIFKDVEICNQFLRMPKKPLMVWNAWQRSIFVRYSEFMVLDVKDEFHLLDSSNSYMKLGAWLN